MLMKIVIAMSAAALLVAAAFAAQAPASAPQTAGADGWRSFEGTLSATCQRQSIATESGLPATTVQLSGPVAITAGEGLSRAFRSEVVGFDDGAGLTVLRGVWTDDRGDRIFTRLKGETVASGRRIAGTITGGTGRYAGITGEYSLEWQYVVEAEAGTISGRAVGLRGRYRIAGAGK
jgi:hypothetical protein